jgi:hypothetical protein
MREQMDNSSNAYDVRHLTRENIAFCGHKASGQMGLCNPSFFLKGDLVYSIEIEIL